MRDQQALTGLTFLAFTGIAGCCFGGLPATEPAPPIAIAPPVVAPPLPPPEPGLEIGSVIFCDQGTHVADGTVLTDGVPYAVLATGTCNLTLRNCVLSSPGDQPTAQVLDGATLRLEHCTVSSTHPNRPALWAATRGHAVVVSTTLTTLYSASMAAGLDGVIELYDTTASGTEELQDNGRIEHLTASPP
ncbi:MAG: hypothetical protein K1X94_19120 [Sandaracinaceae bacterium]|nr:hypothetical protein [Sandaracinaceae bacterium]